MMKKTAFFLVALLVFTACEDIKRNDTILQVSVGQTFLRTENPTAVLNTNGTLTISGSSGNQTLSLIISDGNPGIYYFGTDNTNVAHYKILQDDQTYLEYSTIEGTENTDLEPNLGQLTIYPANHIKASKNAKTISGEFRFRGKILTQNDPTSEPTIFFHQGFFYNLPIQNE